MNQPKFWIGCFSQPVESFSKWVKEGVNVCIQPAQSNNNTAQQRRKAAIDAGMWVIDVPESLADVEDLISNPMVYGLCLPDEPEIGAKLPWFNDPTFSQKLNDWLAIYKPRFDAVKGRKPVWCNVAGAHAMNARPSYQMELIRPFVEKCGVTDLSMDIYPINSNFQSDWVKWNAQTTHDVIFYGINGGDINNGPDPLRIPGENQQVYCTRLLQNYFPNCKSWAYLDVCKWTPLSYTNGRGPTPDEIQQQVDAQLKMGVKGLVYFTVAEFGSGLPWDPAGANGHTAWDTRTDAQAAKCKEIAMNLTNPNGLITPFDQLQNRVAVLENRMMALEARAITDVTLKRGSL